MKKIKQVLIGLVGGLLFALGIIVGVKIDKDVVIKGKIKQKTGRGGQSNIKDITADMNVTNKKIDRQLKKTKRKQEKEQNKLLRKSK